MAGEAVKIPIAAIEPNRLQPRKNFDAERLSELAQSIKEHGLAQPILVTTLPGGRYELVAGERRLRASQLAGLSEIEAVVRDSLGDKARLALALIENIQRDDLNAVEVAQAYKKLMTDHAISQSDLSRYLGKSRSAVSNTLRLLELSETIQKAIQFERISEGHARALLMVEDPLERDKLFHRALEGKLSVREVENMARLMAGGKTLRGAVRKSQGAQKPADLRALEDELTRLLSMKVEIRLKSGGKSGALLIEFYSLSDFDKLMEKIKK